MSTNDANKLNQQQTNLFLYAITEMILREKIKEVW